jgi:hypothetical protein
MTVPEINGKPAASITVGAEEKINLGNYSNVVIGPISVTRFVEDDDEVIDQALRDTMQDRVEALMAEERANILELVRAS